MPRIEPRSARNGAQRNGVQRLWRRFGPGITSGAADDDPSGITTYSIAGAQFGLALLWTALLTWPLMAAVQLMCSRIGMVTGGGLMAAFTRRIPRALLIPICLALFSANTLNIGADLAAMADAAELLTGISSHLWAGTFAVGILWSTIQLHYASMANVLKWLTLVLVAYVATAIKLGPDWHAVLQATVTPNMPAGDEARSAWGTLVAILGTTISPYLFFWQAAQEVEEEKAMGRHTQRERVGATTSELRWRRLDVGIGTFWSNLVMFFIILTTALTLYPSGMSSLSTSREVAEALRPLAGSFATTLYAIGLIGTGALAIPTLAGSAAYASAELFGWRQGMDERLRAVPGFYAVIIVSVLMGVSMDLLNVNPIQALYWSAVVNGLLAPILLTGIVVVASDPVIMQGQPSPRMACVSVAATALVMTIAAIGLLATMWRTG